MMRYDFPACRRTCDIRFHFLQKPVMRMISSILAIFISTLVLSACSDSGTGTPEDPYEPNNDIANATPTTAKSEYEGRLFDEDWFQINVTTGFERVVANLAFNHANGDIDLELVDAGGNVLATSESTTNNEQIDFTVSTGGDYYLRVFDFNNGSGNIYALSWSGTAPPPADDQYEENDDIASAMNKLALTEDTTLVGVQLDDDWYKINVQPGFERVVANLIFTHANGDLDLELYDSNQSQIGLPSKSSTDNERIAVDVITNGDYYLRVYNYAGSSTGNSYTLVWDAPSDDLYEPNNDLLSARELLENTNISAIQLDFDWYRITGVTPGQNLHVELTFNNNLGDLDLVLYNSTGVEVANSLGITDIEIIDYIATSPNDYFVRVESGNNIATGNTYGLIWTSSP